MKKLTIQKNRGYTLLFAVLVSSVVLGIGISILNVSKKEFLISTSARDSSAAFYAADAGIECAIAAGDNGAFDTDSDKTATNFVCNMPYSFQSVSLDDPEGTFVFHFRAGSTDPDLPSQTAIQAAGKSCGVVTVTKAIDPEAGEVRRTIDSRGYNVGWKSSGPGASSGTCDQLSAKRVERGIRYSD